MKQKISVSANKQDYPTLHSHAQLSIAEIYNVSQYYKKKKNIRLYVQTYLGDLIEESSDPIENMRKIQEKLTEGEHVGYLHTRGRQSSDTPHIEGFIVTKTQIIKPVKWNVASDEGGIFLDGIEGCASTDTYGFTGRNLIPQSDISSCATLSLVTLKQLLEDDARQLRELTLSIPYFSYFLGRSKLHYFFVPSPQVLRYSQSTKYNQYLLAIVMEDKPGDLLHKGEKTYFNPLKSQLEGTIYEAQKRNLPQIEAEARLLLDQLPAFRQAWKAEFDQMELKRAMMDRKARNLTLAYTSKRMQKIALIEVEQRQNPGLALLQAITNKKQNESISDIALLSFFSHAFSECQFQDSQQFGYFLSQICKLIDSRILYPYLFQFEHLYSYINHPQKYMDCSFLLDPVDRHNLHDYMKTRLHYDAMFDGCDEDDKSDPSIVLNWAHALNINTKQEILTFLQERVNQELFAPLLLEELVRCNDTYSCFFESKEALSEFLKEYIGEERVISSLSTLITKGSCFESLEIMFFSKADFYVFIEKHMPFERAVFCLKDHKYFSLHINSYINHCMDPSKRGSLIGKELNNTDSILYTKLMSEGNPRALLECLVKYCNELDVGLYLSSHRLCLLEKIISGLYFSAIRVSSQFENIALRTHFFSITDPAILALYQKAFFPFETYKQKYFLTEILQFLPPEQRLDFIKQVFANMGQDFINNIIQMEEIQKFLPPPNKTLNLALGQPDTLIGEARSTSVPPTTGTVLSYSVFSVAKNASSKNCEFPVNQM